MGKSYSCAGTVNENFMYCVPGEGLAEGEVFLEADSMPANFNEVFAKSVAAATGADASKIVVESVTEAGLELLQTARAPKYWVIRYRAPASVVAKVATQLDDESSKLSTGALAAYSPHSAKKHVDHHTKPAPAPAPKPEEDKQVTPPTDLPTEPPTEPPAKPTVPPKPEPEEEEEEDEEDESYSEDEEEEEEEEKPTEPPTKPTEPP